MPGEACAGRTWEAGLFAESAEPELAMSGGQTVELCGFTQTQADILVLRVMTSVMQATGSTGH